MGKEKSGKLIGPSPIAHSHPKNIFILRGD
jgi:hypothetical protein